LPEEVTKNRMGIMTALVIRALAIIGATVLLLSGCANQPQVDGPRETTSATPSTPSAETMVSIPMPDLGPSPAPQLLDAARLEALRLSAGDHRWQQLTAQYPDATRPKDLFAGYLDAGPRLAGLKNCFTDAGLKTETGTDAMGNVVTYGASTTNQQGAVAQFSCINTFSTAPVAPPTPEILGYLYDYFTKFLIPCYEANGIQNPPAPTRTEFVTLWPNQRWFPSTGSSPMGTDSESQLNAACPPPPR
jgi:hypothetical protein